MCSSTSYIRVVLYLIGSLGQGLALDPTAPTDRLSRGLSCRIPPLRRSGCRARTAGALGGRHTKLISAAARALLRTVARSGPLEVLGAPVAIAGASSFVDRMTVAHFAATAFERQSEVGKKSREMRSASSFLAATLTERSSCVGLKRASLRRSYHVIALARAREQLRRTYTQQFIMRSSK